jgi:hypothetical protein
MSGTNFTIGEFFKLEMEFEIKIRESKGVDFFEFQLGHFKNSKTLQTWPTIILLHLVQFQISSRVWSYGKI